MEMQQLMFGLLLLYPAFINGGEITFELPDNEQMCFYEEIDKGVETTLEFQVVMMMIIINK